MFTKCASLLFAVSLLPCAGLAQTNWNAFNDFWYTKGQGWSGGTTPNAWGYKAGNTAGGLANSVGTFLPSSHLYDLVSGGSAGTGNGSGDGNVVLYNDVNGIAITTLGRYSTGTVFVTGTKAAGSTVVTSGTKPTAGKVGGAALFDGATSYIDVGTASSLNPSELTYSAWVQATSFSVAYASIISKGEDGRVGTLLVKGNGKLACYLLATGGIVNYDGSGANTLVPGQWYYLTLTYDAVNGLNGYVNGSLDGGAPPNGSIATGADPVWIGAHPTIGGRIFSGAIDEPRVSTVARSADWVWAEWMNMASNSTFASYGPSTANSGGAFAAWSRKAQITFSGYTKSQTLTDFPVLVNIGTNISGFDWSQFANGNGNELRFADSNGNELPYERENGAGAGWTNSTGIGQVWVRVPQLDSITTITAYWGNAAAAGSAPAYNSDGSVWSNGYGGVWHLPNGQTLTTADSTANQNNGTIPTSSSTADAGKVGGGASFNGTTAYINLGNSPTVNPSALTYSAWVNPNILSAAYGSIISKAENGRVATLLLKSNGKLACYLLANGGIVNYDGSGANTISPGQWFYLTMTYDSVNGLAGYVNGAADGAAPANGDVVTQPDAIWVGGHPSIGGRYFSGVMDEVRISTVARSADWVWAEWMNMASNSVFCSYGASSANSGGNFAAWNRKSQISLDGYTRPETLSNFPVLVNIGTNISGFSWSQFANANGYELRFTDSTGNELPYEPENPAGTTWTNDAGLGQVWVLVPQVTSSTVITAYWGNASATSTRPAYCTNGAVWANGFGGVWHTPTPGKTLGVLDSTSNGNNGQAAITPGGINYQNNQYLWAQAANFDLVSGSTPPSATEGFASVLTWTAPHAGTFNFSGSFLPGINIGVPGQSNVTVAIVNSQGGTNLPRTVLTQGAPATPYNFTQAMNSGDSVQFQVGDNFETPAPVGIAANVSQVPTAPVLISAARTFSNPHQVVVEFSDPLYAPSASNINNYSINNGINVLSAQLNPTNAALVVLTVNPGINYSSTLTVNNVQGAFGQLPVAPNSQALISLGFNIPKGFGSPTNAAVVSFTGSLDPHWQSSIVLHDNSQSNYYFSQIFVQSNGVLHARANNQNTDYNFLVYADPAYYGVAHETLMHFSIRNANFAGTAVAGGAVGVQPNAVDSLPPGGNTFRAVPANYGAGPSYPAFIAASDFVADEYPTNRFQEWAVGGSYWLRIRQDVDTNAPDTGAIVSAKAWEGDGSVPEPGNWDLTYKDEAGLDRNGYAAIRAGWGVGGVMDFDVDYFQVTASGLPVVTPRLPPSLIPAVELAVAINGNNAIVSWPVAAPISYVLQSSTSPGGAWTDVNLSVVVIGEKNTVSVPLSGKVFFRLKQ